jgi:hypothetical protein
MSRAETESLARRIFAERHTVRWEDSAPSSIARQEALREARAQLGAGIASGSRPSRANDLAAQRIDTDAPAPRSSPTETSERDA